MLRDVTRNDDDSRCNIVRVADWGQRAIDGHRSSATVDKHRAHQSLRNVPASSQLVQGGGYPFRAAVLCEMKYLAERSPTGLLEAPTGHLRGDGVQEVDPAFGVRGQDSVVKGCERHLGALLLRPYLLLAGMKG